MQKRLVEKVAWRMAVDDALATYDTIQEAVRELPPVAAYKRAMVLWMDKVAFPFDAPAPRTWKDAIVEALNLVPGTYPGGTTPNHPRPFGAMLSGGLIGAGLGAAAGTLGGYVLPDDWDKSRMRRNWALIGGALGAMPGLGIGLMNKANKLPFNDSTFQNSPRPSFWSEVARQTHTGQARERLRDFTTPLEIPNTFKDAADACPGEVPEEFYKLADDYMFASNTGFDTVPPIPVNEFNQALWEDPRVANRLPTSVQAMGTALIEGAARLAGGGGPASTVPPFSVGRLVAGMGGGYLTGALVGKALGALFGMPNSVQDKLKTTGLFAGAIKNLIPLAF